MGTKPPAFLLPVRATCCQSRPSLSTQHCLTFSSKRDTAGQGGGTIRSQACLPSMNPLGMALGVRISYLRKRAEIPSRQGSIGPKASCRSLPLSELLEHDAVGEALPADADPFQNSITPQLVQNQMRLQLPGLTGQISERVSHIRRFFQAAAV